MEAAWAAVWIVGLACCDAVFGATVTARSNIGIPNKVPLELNCSFADFYKWTVGFFQDLTWDKVDGTSSKQIFRLHNIFGALHFNYGWQGGEYNRDHYGDSAKGFLNIFLPAKYVTSDLAGTYKCTVTGSWGQDVSNTTDVTVYYGPRHTIRIHDDGTKFNIVEGQNVTMFCSAECLPACNYSWYFGSELRNSTDGVLYVEETDRRHAGNYTCVARNIADERNKTIELNILHGPGHQIWFAPPHATVTKVEGATISVGCYSHCNPPCRSYWYRGPRHLQTEGDILRLTNVSRDEAGSYICVANNSVTHEKKELEIEINYGPGSSVTLTPNNRTHTVLEHKSVSVTCSAICNPSCTYSWQTPRGTKQKGGMLALSYIIREQAGEYKCEASNNVSTSMASFNLVVLYPPSITDLDANKGNNFVDEGNKVVFSCSVASNPAPIITWTYLETSTILQQKESVFTSTYTIDKAGCLKAGRYSCSAENGIGERAEKNIEIFVYCAPRQDHRALSNLTTYVPLNSELSYTIHMIAYPAPNFTWYHVVAGDLVKADVPHYRQTDNDDSSTLRVTSAQIEDFGHYVVNISNFKGKCAVKFQVLRADRPAVPTKFFCTGHTEASINLHWVSQDDHGAPQVFHIRYNDHKDKVWSNFSEEFNDPGIGQDLEANITELHPQTLYSFRVYGRNRWGYSDFLETKCFTDSLVDVAGTLKEELTFGEGIGVGIAVATVVSLCVIAAVCVYRRKYQRYQAVPLSRPRRSICLNRPVCNITWNNRNEEAVTFKTFNGVGTELPESPSCKNIWQLRNSEKV